MSISRMSQIEVILPRADTAALVAHVQDFGSLQLEEVPLVVPGTRSFLHRTQLSDKAIASKDVLKNILRILTDIKALFPDSTVSSDEELAEAHKELSAQNPDVLHLKASRMKRKSESILRKRHNISHDLQALDKYRARLEQLAPLTEQIDYSESLTHIALLLSHNEQERLDDLVVKVDGLTKGNAHVFQADPDNKKKDSSDVAILAYPDEYTLAVHRAVRASEIAEFKLPRDVKDLPFSEAISQLQAHLTDLPEKLKKVEKDLKKFKADNLAVMTAIDQICFDTLTRLEASSMIAHSSMITVLHGWIPSEELPAFRTSMTDTLGNTAVVTELRETESQAARVPVRLNNSKLFKPFERLLQLFSVPLYGSFDPTPIMAVIFPLFFGLILGDMGYGLILLCLSLWAKKKWKHNIIVSDIMVMALWCSGASILFGIIFGEFLGDLGHRLGAVPMHIGSARILPIWQSREDVIGELLVITIVIGLVHVMLGLVLGMAESIRMKAKHHFWENMGLTLGLISILLFVLPIPVEVISESIRTSTASVMLLASLGILIKYSGVTGPIEIISLCANVLSYCRLMALGVAGMVIANLANDLASQQSNILLGIIIAIPIHMLAIALGILEPTIHALRLHYVEFLPKFFIGDGRTYTPLQRKDKSND